MKVNNYKIVVCYVCLKTEVSTDFRTSEGCQTKNKPFSVVHLWNQTGLKILGYSWYRALPTTSS